ncbi:MAG TPA: hypothetical protein VL523_05545, partial [Terriglobia bacterium]|nr:hypothetical protein [Terriglobia bacterium]
NWSDVVKLANDAPAPVDVIVVSRLDDVGLYLETIEKGAFDFISAPLPGSDFAHVVQCASTDVGRRRKTSSKSPRVA